MLSTASLKAEFAQGKQSKRDITARREASVTIQGRCAAINNNSPCVKIFTSFVALVSDKRYYSDIFRYRYLNSDIVPLFPHSGTVPNVDSVAIEE